ncbi:MAG: terminase large subunit domain-containing protein [Candidatus Acidiferrales bacterium]
MNTKTQFADAGHFSDALPTTLGAPQALSRQIYLDYSPFPKQQEFHSSPARYRLFGGAAGPGKTKALLMEAILQANAHSGVDTLLLRRTYSELESTLLQYFRRDIPRALYRSFNTTKHIVTWHNGSTTRFGYCRNEGDVFQYQGGEFVFIGIDELTHFTLRQWQFLTSRNRCSVAGTFPNMAGATNPGNIGHAWVKALWIDRVPAPGMDRPDEYDPADYAFIPARISDNPIFRHDAGYLKTLEALPSHLRQAFLEGDWNVFSGQYFDVFSPDRHVVRAENLPILRWWPRWISIDWGFEHPAAVYWHTCDSSNAPPTDSATQQPVSSPTELEAQLGNASQPRTIAVPRRRVFTYRELVQQHLAPRSLAQEIVERSRDREGYSEKIDAIYLSPDAFAQRTAEASIAEQMGDAFSLAGMPRPVPADNDRVGGWMRMYQMLADDEWLLASNCEKLIESLPLLIRDPARVEDVLKYDGDDAADAARYGLKSRAPHANPPFPDRVAAKITSADPTIRAIQARKALIEERKRGQPISFLHRPGGVEDSSH